jgi:hypothetical protein
MARRGYSGTEIVGIIVVVLVVLIFLRVFGII